MTILGGFYCRVLRTVIRYEMSVYFDLCLSINTFCSEKWAIEMASSLTAARSSFRANRRDGLGVRLAM